MAGPPFGLLPPDVERVAHARAARLDGEIDDGGGAAEGSGARAGFEIVGRRGAAERHVEMGVDIDAAGHHVHSCRVDHRRRGIRRNAGAHLANALAFDQNVGGVGSVAVTTVPLRIRVSSASLALASLFPGLERLPVIDLFHGDAIFHRAHQPAKIAAHAFVFIHARNAGQAVSACVRCEHGIELGDGSHRDPRAADAARRFPACACPSI